MRAVAFLILAITCAGYAAESTAPLARLQHKIVGTELRVTPSVLSVPKAIPGSLLIQVLNADGSTNSGTARLSEGAHLEATLRGPSFEARRLVGPPGQALMLPPLSLVGDYRLDNIRLVDTATGETRMEGTPPTVPLRVFDEVLVSRVTSRPLTFDEIKEKGIVIDEQNFRAVEFEVGFVLDGKTIPVKFPVVAPTFRQSTEIIPRAELEARLLEAQRINEQIAWDAAFPPELETAGLNIQVQGINFQEAEGLDQDLQLKIPPIPALMVIPGNIGFLNQFFSVQIFTENAAPAGSGLNVFNVQAELILPPGPDRIASTNYAQPGDDPLRFARTGSDKIIQPIQPVVRSGPDGEIGTSDDIGRLFPGESGEGEFLIEGLQEGLHIMDLSLTADLDGLAAGTVKIKGKAAGSVLVRNPKFSLAFSHPRTVRSGEPYEAYVTILNTSITPANLVSVTLPSTALSGGVLESSASVELGTILPGQTATAKFRIRPQRTGAVSFSNLTTSDDSVVGRFRLRMGIDERGVALSPDTIGMPDFVDEIPLGLIDAANRVLGQALSVATAAQLPPGVRSLNRSIITKRVLELAEAGQRLRYGDPVGRVLPDLLLDWQGGRSPSDGFDQILRETEAGLEFRLTLARTLESGDTLNADARLLARARDLAGLGQSWTISAASDPGVEVTLGADAATATLARSDVRQAMGYPGLRGGWMVARPSTNQLVVWRVTNALPRLDLAVVTTTTNGTAQVLQWSISNPQAGSCFTYSGNSSLSADLNCDGQSDSSLPGESSVAAELPPTVVSVWQDTSVHAGRPSPSCLFSDLNNYGTILAVLYSKPMTQDSVNAPGAYRLENGNSAGSVQIQPGGRVALLNMRQPVSAIRPRTLTVTNISDQRGNSLASASQPVRSELTRGVSIRGRVVRADGIPVAGVPVTLTMHDEKLDTGFSASCETFIVRVSQVQTDADGLFEFDYVMSGIPYTISATDTSSLSPEAAKLIAEAANSAEGMREGLQRLASATAFRNTLLAEFATAALPEAIALAEGVDRALVRDFIPNGSPREGSEVPIALRFRGRGTVAGEVFRSDGTTPAAQAAVNLFPDPSSRELGRGILTDADGRFAFAGVPLGLFTVQAQDSLGAFRTVSSSIEQSGGVTNITIVLSSVVVGRTDLHGTVFEADNVTVHGNAQVFVGRYGPDGMFGGVVAAATADPGGFWRATGVPTGNWDLVAISSDGRRKGDRRQISASLGSTNTVAIPLQSTGVVIGRVEFGTGRPAPNALVAGGEAIVRTDANGNFRLSGVPTGRRTISAGVERNTNAVPSIDFPRLGSAELDVIAGIDNFVVVRLRAAGQIVGRVLDANGQPVGGVRVAMPMENGFQWVNADAAGNYVFANLGLGIWTVSAPAGPVAERDVGGLLSTLRTSSSEDELQAALGKAYDIFTGRSDPFLNGEGALYNPFTWGYNSATLSADGQTVVADIRFRRQGTVSGRVLNGQGVPIGARVRLTGLGPAPNGAPITMIRGEVDTDPALGVFEFPNALLAGPWGIQVASPFYPAVITAGGQTSSTEPHVTNLVMQFPPTREVNGRLTGFVELPGGESAGGGVRVKISFGNDYVITTDTNGFFDTQIAIPEGGYSVEAEDPATSLRGLTRVHVTAGQTNLARVRLLGRGATIVAQVRFADGSIAPGADVELQMASYPGGAPLKVKANTAGQAEFPDLFEGTFSLAAQTVLGPTRIGGRAGVQLAPGQTTHVTITLAPTANVRGRFLQRDQVTPVGFAQVAVGTTGFATTDETGAFEINGLPLGTYRITAQNPVTGVGAIGSFVLSTQGETRDVQLIEQARGLLRGTVLNSYGNGFVPGAEVVLQVYDGISPNRTVTTGPDGAFSFPGTPAAPFTIQATDPITKLTGRAAGILSETADILTADIQIEPLGNLAVHVFSPGATHPATNTTVQIFAGNTLLQSADTDEAGHARFNDIRLSSYTLRAYSRAGTDSRNVGQTNVTLSAGLTNQAVVILRGVGSVRGTVLESDGTRPSEGAQVTLNFQSPTVSGETTAVADAAGQFSFDNVPVGAYRVTAESTVLGASVSGAITNHLQSDTLSLRLGASGTIRGKLVRADGVTPVTSTDLLLTFPSQTGVPGKAFARSGFGGEFQFENVPVGSAELEAIVASVGGIARVATTLTTNAEMRDLGPVHLDEADPRVIEVTPVNSAAAVNINTTVDLEFSEELAASTLTPNGVLLRLGTNPVPASVQLLTNIAGIRALVRLVPSAPLRSETRYEVVVIDGERMNAFGQVIGSGPRDLVGRPLAAPFVSSFTTADQEPPRIVSVSPAVNESQIDPRVSVRLTFNEAIRTTNYAFSLFGPGGAVSGQTAVALNGLALVFTPSAELMPNTTYAVTLDGVRDLAGNSAVGMPLEFRFSTLDTLGPNVATLRLAAGQTPVAGSTVQFEAVLATNEAGAFVRFTSDFEPIGTATNAPFRAALALPQSGSTVVRAIATDRFGNDGPLVELAVAVTSNQPPVIELLRQAPLTGPIQGGQILSLILRAQDDVRVTNMTLVSAGALAFSTNFPTGATTPLNILIPSNTPPGAIHLVAQATDSSGLRSPETLVMVPVLDGARPDLAILGPLPDVLLGTNAPLVLTFGASDNSSNLVVEAAFSGALTVTQQLALDIVPGIPVTHSVTQSLALARHDGTPLSVTLRAADLASNVHVLTRTYRLPDLSPPRLLSVTPADGEAGQSLWFKGWTVSFSEPVDVLTLTTNTVAILDSVGRSIPFVVAGNPSNVEFVPLAPLPPGQRISLGLLPAITDASGNQWVGTDTNAVPTNGLSFSITTASLELVSPIASARVIAGQSVPIRLAVGAGAGTDTMAFSLNGAPVTRLAIASTNVTASVVIPTNATGARLQVLAERANSVPFAFPAITFDVRPANGDEDADGWQNGFEIAREMDPFVADADSADFDSDGLNNGEEKLAGSDPALADTDGDGTPDGSDDAPLLANYRPGAGLAVAENALDFDGTNDYAFVPFRSGSPLFSLANRFTYEVWINPRTAGPLIVRQQCNNAWPAAELMLVEAGGSALGIAATLNESFGPGFATFVASNAVPRGEWSHIALTFDLSARAVNLYRNGSNIFTGSFNGAVYRPGTPFFFGGYPKPVEGCHEAYWAGSLDEIRIWDLARTEAEIRASLHARLTGNEPGLAGYWRFDEPSGTNASDRAASAHHAILPATAPAWTPSQARLFEQEGLVVRDRELRLTLQAADADPLDTLVIRLASLPRHGTLYTADRASAVTNIGLVLGRQFVYVPKTNFTGVDSFRFVANDSKIDSFPATFVLRVVPPTDSDSDGVPDEEELIAGTDPANPDSDGDGLLDGVDPEPLVGARRPVLALAPEIEIVQGLPATIEVRAQDADGNLKGLRIASAEGQPSVEFYSIGSPLSQLDDVNFESTPALATNWTAIAFTGEPFWPNGPNDFFAVRLRGSLLITNAGNYTFWTSSDDGSDLYVGEQRVVNNDGQHGVVTQSGTISLQTGLYPLLVRMFENGGGAYLTAEWSGPGFDRRLLTVDAANSWRQLAWSESGNAVYQITNPVPSLSASLQLQYAGTGTSIVEVAAFDGDGLATTQRVSVVVLGDLDSDGEPDRSDPDIDGDNLLNTAELANGTNPLKLDTDGDGLRDDKDPFPTLANRRPYVGGNTNAFALRFDGQDDYVLVGNPPAVRLTGNTTIEFWIKPEVLGIRQNPFAKAYAGEGTITLEPDGELSYFYGTGGANNEPYMGVGSVEKLSIGAWTHVALVRNLSGGTVQWYINGQLSGQADAQFSEARAGDLPLYLGRGYVSSFNGELGDVRIWSTVRTADEIARDLGTRLTGSEPGLVAGWPFDEGTNLIALDLSTNQLQGRLGDGNINEAPRWTNGIESVLFHSIIGGAARITLPLTGTDVDGPANFAVITRLPSHGNLFLPGLGGAAITTVPVTLDPAVTNVVYVSPLGLSATDVVLYHLSDGTLVSGQGVHSIRVAEDPSQDTDRDGLPDVYEVARKFDPEINDAALDPDNDSLSVLAEFGLGTDPRKADTDGDGLSDSTELALTTDPLNSDTDGDGVLDGADPEPKTGNTGLVLSGPSTIMLMEGSRTNLAFQVTSFAAPIVRADYAPGLVSPGFASIGSMLLANSDTNGSVQFDLNLLPLHDSAGTHRLRMVFGDARGSTNLLDLEIVVQDNPALAVTRWKDPVDGNWSDASKWSDGLPNSSTVAVIDAPGAYTVNWSGNIQAAGVVLNHTAASIHAYDTTVDAPVEIRAGLLRQFTGGTTTLRFNQPVINSGTIAMVSRYYSSRLDGAAYIENRGVLTSAVGVGGVNSAEARITLPLHTVNGGAVQLPDAAFVAIQDVGDSRVSGQISLGAGSVLRLTGSGTRSISAWAGAEWLGRGALRIDGANNLAVVGDVPVASYLDLRDSSFVSGHGRLVLHGTNYVSGSYRARVEFAENARIDVYNASFTTNVLIRPGAVLAFHPDGHHTMTLEGLLTNRGTVRLVSRYYYSRLLGSGRVVNEGLIDSVVGVGGLNNEAAVVGLNVRVAAGGRWLMPANMHLKFTAGGSLDLSGTLEAETGSLLRFENSGPPRSLVVGSGARLLGKGTLRFEGANTLKVNAPTDLNPYLDLRESSAVEGPGPLNFRGAHYVHGLYRTPLIFAADANIDCYNPTFSSNVLVSAGAVLAINPNGHHTVTLHGILTNRGALRLVSRYYYSRILGTGSLQNEGLIDGAVSVGGTNNDEAQIGVPVHVAAGARLLMPTNMYVNFTAGGALTLAGALEMQQGSRLRFDSSGPARALTVAPGGTLNGPGRVRLDGANTLDLQAPLDLRSDLDLRESSTVTGSGALVFHGQRYAHGPYRVPVIFASDAEVTVYHPVFSTNVLVRQGATLAMRSDGHYTMTFNGPVTNQGTIRLVSRYYYSRIQGSGSIENEGLIDSVVAVGGLNNDEAVIGLPVHVGAQGRLLMPTNMYLNMTAGGSLSMAGALEMQTGTRLRFDGSGQARALTLDAGSQTIGKGVIRLDGSNRLTVNDRVELSPNLDLRESSSVDGPGILVFRGEHWIQGPYAARLEFAPDAVVDAYHPTFGTNVLISAGALVAMNPNGHYNMTVNGALTNRGTLRLVSRYYYSRLTGSGVVENEGVIDSAVAVGGMNNEHGYVSVPVHVARDGRFLLPENARFTLTTGTRLMLEGVLEVQNGAMLRVENSSTSPGFEMASGSLFTGAGTTQIEQSGMVTVSGPAVLEGSLNLIQNSVLTGAGLLTIRPGATLRIDHPTTVSGSLETAGALTFVTGSSQILGTLTLQQGGVLNNPAQLAVGAFVNNGGVINGNPPTIIVPSPQSVARINALAFSDPALAGNLRSQSVGSLAVILTWSGRAGRNFEVQATSNLVTWTVVDANAQEVGPGQYRAHLALPSSAHRYFRVRELAELPH